MEFKRIEEAIESLEQTELLGVITESGIEYLEELKQVLSICEVMHRRELLIDLLKWVDDGYNMGETAERIVDDYIKTKGNL